MIWTRANKAKRYAGEEGESNIWTVVKMNRGRPKRTFNGVIEWDLLVNNLYKDLVFDRAQ